MNNMSLAKRVTINILLAVLICVVPLLVFAFFIERKVVIEQNAETALSIARTVSAALDAEEYKKIMQTGEINEYYTSFKEFLDATYQASQVGYLYIVDADYDTEVTYFAEGYPKTPRPGEPELVLGDRESIEGIYDKQMFNALKTGENTVELDYRSSYHNLISGTRP